MKLLSKTISSFFGVGYFPVAPGTFTSLLVILGYKYYLFQLNWSLHLLILFLLFFIGVYVSTKVESESRKKDPRKIVIDEACGQLLVLFRMGDAWFPLISGFILFRIFDITKPFPIKKVETLPSGWGIMMDDVVAAIYAGVIINLYLIIT